MMSTAANTESSLIICFIVTNINRFKIQGCTFPSVSRTWITPRLWWNAHVGHECGFTPRRSVTVNTDGGLQQCVFPSPCAEDNCCRTVKSGGQQACLTPKVQKFQGCVQEQQSERTWSVWHKVWRLRRANPGRGITEPRMLHYGSPWGPVLSIGWFLATRKRVSLCLT